MMVMVVTFALVVAGPCCGLSYVCWVSRLQRMQAAMPKEVAAAGA